ncbi:MAG: prepilin peptidase [Candidatus Methanoperedens sp.]|nr:prepilin peptidase [Candidatus Methanoperedens sp.]
MLDILKIIFLTPFLLYSCISDIKTRRVPNKLWVVMLSLGSVFIVYDVWSYGLNYLIWMIISTVLTFAFVYILFQFGVFGGADAKSLITLSIIFPVYPNFILFNSDFPLHDPLPIFNSLFAFGIFENAVLLTIVVPLGLALYNVSKMGVNIDKPLYAFIGYKTKISELSQKKHIKLIEYFEIADNEIKFFFKRGGVEIDEKVINKLKNAQKKGLIKDDIWVTPGLPFMIPITLGFFAAAFYGDLITELTKYILFN